MAKLRKLVFGTANNSAGINANFGIEKGFFAERGIDLTNIRIPGGPNVARAVGEGTRVELGMFGTPPGLTAIARGADMKIIAGGTKQRYQMNLLVRPAIAGWAAFKGVRVGLVAAESCDEWPLRDMLRARGGDPDRDLSFVVVGYDYTAIEEMLRHGEIDAVMQAEPVATRYEMAGVARRWLSGHEVVKNYQWSITCAHPRLLERDPELVCDFLDGSAYSAKYMVDHPDEWAAFTAREFDIPLATARRAIERQIPITCTDCGLDFAGLEQAIALQLRTGAIPRKLNIAEIVDFRFAPDTRATTAA